MKQYNVHTKDVPARSRNKRDLRIAAGMQSSVTLNIQGGNGGGAADPNSHTHNNKTLLDSLFMDALGYLYTRVMDSDSGESILKKIKAGYADMAMDLAEESPVWDKVLRKDKPDQTAHLIQLLGGLIVDGATALLNQGAQFGESFADGLTGHGGRIDGKGYGELRGLRLWEWLEVPELRYNCVKVFVGIDWQVVGAGIIESVTVDLDQQGKPLSTGTVKLKLEQGQYGAIDTDDIAMGIYHFGDERDATADKDDSKGNFAFAGFATSYFRITSVSGAHNETFKYALRPGYGVHPQPMMHFACYGNFSNKDRQTSTYRTRSYTRRLWKQNTWEIAIDNIAAQDGDLSNLNIHGMRMDGYSAYLNNIYFNGTIEALKKPDGTTIKIVNDRGAWVAGRYDYYDRVSHRGELWLCVNEKGTTSEPSASNPDWLLQVAKGEGGKATYTWIRYANDANGAGISNDPTGKEYIGYAYNKETATESENPKDYTWSKFKGDKGDKGDGFTQLGQWKSGMLVPKLGVVRMAGSSYVAKTATRNPPLWTYTNPQGDRYISSNGGYSLTGEENTAEYDLLAAKGEDGLNGADGVSGKDGESIVWKGTFDKHPSNPQNGWAYYNTADKKSYIYQDGQWYQMTIDGVDGKNGKDGLSIEWKGDLKTPPANPQKNWAYRDVDNGKVYIWNGSAWALMVVDGSDGLDGAKGADGNSVFITYHDSETKPATPTGDGTTGGWHHDATDKVRWMSQKVASAVTAGTWGAPIEIKGEKGDGYIQLGQWKTGMLVPKMGVVRMGGSSFVAKVSTRNPPMWVYTDPSGNRYITASGYYFLAGAQNTVEYELLAQKGEDGKDGKPGADGHNGSQGIQGCIMRDSEWQVGVQYRNDEALTSGIRYIDVALVYNANASTGYNVYRCIKTHTSSASNKPGTTGGGAYWEVFAANVSAIYTSFLLAKNAKIKFLAGTQMVSLDANGNPIAGMSGGNISFWAGGADPSTAPFRVSKSGVLTATNANITGTVNATSGSIGGFVFNSEGISSSTTSTGNKFYLSPNHLYFSRDGGNIYAEIGNSTPGYFINRTKDPNTGGNGNAALKVEVTRATKENFPQIWIDCTSHVRNSNSCFRVENRAIKDGIHDAAGRTCIWTGLLPPRDMAVRLVGKDIAYKVILVYDGSTGKGLLAFE